ncbi:MAG: zf-HC2 domain-containing protein [Christensenellales bacterium]|jgi:hypothetical protein
MNKYCDVARDLMPLYIDKVASEKSAEFVKEHIKECKDCAVYMERLKADFPKKTEEEKKQEREALMQANARLKKKKRGRTWRSITLGAAIATALIFFGILGYNRLSMATKPLALKDYDINLSELKDGTVILSADYKGLQEQTVYFSKSVPQTSQKTGNASAALYLEVDSFRIPRKFEQPLQNGFLEKLSADEFEKYDRICKGNADNYEVIWERGDKIKPASEEMEQYFKWQEVVDSFDAKSSLTADGKMIMNKQQDSYRQGLAYSQLFALRDAVPEWQPLIDREKQTPLDDDTINWILEKSDCENSNGEADSSHKSIPEKPAEEAEEEKLPFTKLSP